MSERFTTTRDIWLAAYFWSCGLAFVRAAQFPGQHFRVTFFFDDSQGCAGELTERFRADVALRRLIDGRKALAGVLDVVRERGVCDPADLPAELARISQPAERAE